MRSMRTWLLLFAIVSSLADARLLRPVCLLSLGQRIAPLLAGALLLRFALLHDAEVLAVPLAGVCAQDVSVEEEVCWRPLVGGHPLQAQSSVLHRPQAATAADDTTAADDGRRCGKSVDESRKRHCVSVCVRGAADLTHVLRAWLLSLQRLVAFDALWCSGLTRYPQRTWTVASKDDTRRVGCDCRAPQHTEGNPQLRSVSHQAPARRLLTAFELVCSTAALLAVSLAAVSCYNVRLSSDALRMCCLYLAVSGPASSSVAWASASCPEYGSRAFQSAAVLSFHAG